MKYTKSLYLIVAFMATIMDRAVAAPSATASGSKSSFQYKVRGRRNRIHDSVSGKLRRKLVADFTQEQLLTYRRLGINCGGYGYGGGKGDRRFQRRAEMRAIHSYHTEECVCSDDLGVCWRMDYGDTGDDKTCCIPEANTDDDDDDGSHFAPGGDDDDDGGGPSYAAGDDDDDGRPSAPVPTPPVNLAPPVSEHDLSNDDPTSAPVAI